MNRTDEADAAPRASRRLEALGDATPEVRLCHLIARPTLDGDDASALRSLLTQVDWPTTQDLAAFHKLLPQLWAHLSRDGGDLAPADVMHRLRERAQSTAVRVLFLSSEMARIAQELRAAGVPLLVLKGPSLAEAYGGIALRPFVDNDILVRRSDFARSERALLEMGFDRLQRSQRQLDGYLYVHGEYTFGRRAGGLVSTVDVHTRVVPRGYSYAGTFERLAERSREVTVGGETVRAAGWPDLFLVLAINALKDQWGRLRLATDLAATGALIQEWEALEALAVEHRCLRAFRLSVLVAADAVGAAFPDEAVTRARGDAWAVAAARQVCVRLQAPLEADGMTWRDRSSLFLGAQDPPAGALRYLGYVALRRLTEPFVRPHTRGAATRPA